jgi:hypothetical protein
MSWLCSLLRWLLLNFKREFNYEDSLKIFEIISSHHLELWSLEAEKERRLKRAEELKNQGTVHVVRKVTYTCISEHQWQYKITTLIVAGISTLTSALELGESTSV